MSGGALDYAFVRVSDIASEIERRADKPIHIAFAVHLHKVADALRDLEWVWSGDTSDGDEDHAIMSVISQADILSEAVQSAMKARRELDEAISSAQKLEKRT